MWPLKTSRLRVPGNGRRRVGAAAALLAVLAPAQAAARQAAPTAEPAASEAAVREVVDRYVAALGGNEALARLRDRRAEGTEEEGGRDLPRKKFRLYWSAPNSARLEISQGSVVIYEGYDGKKGWAEEFFGESTPLGAAAIAKLVVYADPLRYARAFELYDAVTMEKEAPDATGRTVLRATAKGVTDRLFFDPKTNLLVEVETDRADSEAAPTRYHFEEYRRADGVLFPFVIREVIPIPNLDPAAIRIENVIRFKAVKHNQLLPAKLFQPPQ